MALSLLAGRTATRLEPGFPDKKPGHDLAAALAALQGGIDYLKAPVEEHVKAEAAKVAEADRLARAAAEERAAKLEAEAAISAQASKALLSERERSIAVLRELAEQTDAQLLEVRAAKSAAEQELARARAELEQLAEARLKLEQDLRAERTKPAPAPIQIQPLKPEKIDFEPIRRADGLLARVVLRAKGYEDVTVHVVRGEDNRMRQLKIGESK